MQVKKIGGASNQKPTTGRRLQFWTALPMAAILCGAALTCGCTTFQDYVRNGFKVGPNYERPPAPVAKTWIDADDVRIKTAEDDISKWWTVFNDQCLIP